MRLRLLQLNSLLLLTLVMTVPFAAQMFWPIHGVDRSYIITDPVESQRWYLIFGSALAFIVTCLTWRGELTIKSQATPVMWTAVGWFIYFIIRTVLVQDQDIPRLDFLTQIAFLMIFVSGLQCGRVQRQVPTALVGFNLIVIILSLIAIGQKFGFSIINYGKTVPGTTEIAKGKLITASTFGHPNYMGSFLAPIWVLAVHLWLKSRPVVIRAMAVMAAIVIPIALIAGGTRGPMLGGLAGLAIYFSMLKPDPFSIRRPFQWPFTWLLIFGVIVIGLFIRSDRLFATKEIASRVFYWNAGLDMFSGNVVWGIGPGQFDVLFWNRIIRMPETGVGERWHFILTEVIRGVQPGYLHNDHLQVLVETGLVGASFWLLFWTAIISTSLRVNSMNARTSHINAAITGALCTVGIDACFGFPFHLPCSGALFWYLAGLWAGSSYHINCTGDKNPYQTVKG